MDKVEAENPNLVDYNEEEDVQLVVDPIMEGTEEENK